MKMERLEEENCEHAKSAIKARSIRDKQIFHNIPKKLKEDATKIVHNLLEEKLGLNNVRENIKALYYSKTKGHCRLI